jgi:hypothetical protein
MSQIGSTKHIRLDERIYDQLKELSSAIGFSQAEIASWCIEDCLKAYERNTAITPRIVAIARAVKAGPIFIDAEEAAQ